MISNEEINDLVGLFDKGIGIREVIIAAHQMGRAYELAALVAAQPIVDSIRKQVEAAEKVADPECYCGAKKGAHSVGQLQCPIPGRRDFYQWQTFRECIDPALRRLDAHFEFRGGCEGEN